MDTTEFKRMYLWLLLACVLLNTSSCATLTKDQRNSLSQWATACSEFSDCPSRLYQAIAELRKDRGTLYAASLTDPEIRLGELNALHEGWKRDLRASGQLDIAAEAMCSYARALEQLSHPNRWTEFGVRARSLGRRLDSLSALYNHWNPGNTIPSGYGNLAGKSSAAIGSFWIRHRQAQWVRKYISAADTLIGSISNEVIRILNSGETRDLLENEAEGLRLSYRSLLQQNPPGPELDRHYLELLHKADQLSSLRTRTVTAARTLRNAHARLATAIFRQSSAREYLELWEEHYKEWDQVVRQYSKLNSTKDED